MSWHSDDYEMRPRILYSILAIFVLAIIFAVYMLARNDNKQRRLCEERGGSWERNPDDCALICTVRGTAGQCLVYSKVCGNHCVVPR